MLVMKKELESLFNEWRQAHVIDEETDKTFPCFERSGLCPADKIQGFKEFFIPDGCVEYERYSAASQKVLFILKEPAMIRDENSISFIESTYGKMDKINMDDHWYKNLITQNGSFDRKYYRKFKAVCDLLKVDPLCTALMNLNKRGGFKRTDSKRLDRYIEHYSYFIKQQIQILNPDIIISCYRNKPFSNSILGVEDDDWVCCDYTSGRDIWLYHKRTKLFDKEVCIYSLPHPAIPMGPNKYACILENLLF